MQEREVLQNELSQSLDKQQLIEKLENMQQEIDILKQQQLQSF